jgi:hypothetical protein
MPKNRKTREQKFLSDIRKQRASVSQSEIALVKESHLENASVITQKPIITRQSRSDISTSSYAYLSHDLWKTFFLTISVVVVELLLHFFVIR